MHYDERSECIMTHLTVRRLPPRLGEALRRETRRRGASLNQTVIDLLEQALGTAPGTRRSNGLRALAGRWSASEARAFDAAVRDQERIDEDLWR
jgi:hypothetical protein